MSAITTMQPPAQLWIDYPDAPDRIHLMRQSGEISAQEAEQLLSFRELGYIIFPRAIDVDTVDAVRKDLLEMHQESEKYLARVYHKKVLKVVSPKKSILPPKSRLLDFYVNNELTRDMALAPILTRFLVLLYGEAPLLFQSLLFTWGTEHSIHADNTYIVSDPPCTLMASWIALEDVEKGNGELAYYPGSHRDPLVVFDDNKIAWTAGRDGKDAHVKYTEYLLDYAKLKNREPEYFYARKGDVMLWHGNLVHYGTKITQKDRTRYSLLAHYCPSQSAVPNYFKFFKEASKRPWKDGFYSSRRYDLRPGIENPYPVFRG